MKRLVAILLIPLLVVAVPVFAQESFPFVAQVINDRVNVRAGGNQNFEKLCQLEKGEELVVVGKDFSWYKVQLPPGTPVYVSEKYVRRLNDLEGEITADRVNVRARANTDATIVGQAAKESKIRILGKKEGWYTIAPPPEIFGWVADTLLAFKSGDISTYQPSGRIVQTAQPPAVAVPMAAPTPAATAAAGQEVVSVTGILDVPRYPRGANAPYALLIRNKPAYFIRGPKAMLDDFLRYTVTVEGVIKPDAGKEFSRPVMDVVRIQLVL